LHKRIIMKFEDSSEFEALTGLVFNSDWADLGVRTSTKYNNLNGSNIGPSFQIANLRLVSRVGPDNNQVNQIIFSLIQRSGVVVENGEFKTHYQPGQEPTPDGGFELWGGCTLIFDLDSLKLKYAISRPLLDIPLLASGKRQISRTRIEKQYSYQNDEDVLGMDEYSRYFGIRPGNEINEPFALLHQH